MSSRAGPQSGEALKEGDGAGEAERETERDGKCEREREKERLIGTKGKKTNRKTETEQRGGEK